LVSPQYHAMHHLYPKRFLGSFTKTIDYMLTKGR
jgi:hypothetical protein